MMLPYPFGYAEKSEILLLQNGLQLTNDEALAIRWHMHAWGLLMQYYEAKGNFNKAKEICPMVQLLIAADGLASQVWKEIKKLFLYLYWGYLY